MGADEKAVATGALKGLIAPFLNLWSNSVLGKMAGSTGLVHIALVFVQVAYGGYHVVVKVALKGGVNQFVFCALRDIIALAILAPVAFFGERGRRPPMTRGLLASFILLGMTGILGNQLLFMFGLNYTSPMYAAAMQPSIPVLTFLLAIVSGAETVFLRRKDGQAKVAGVLACVSGALLMAIYRGAPVFGTDEANGLQAAGRSALVVSEDVSYVGRSLASYGMSWWHLGVVCLIGNCISMSVYIAVQSPVLQRYPAPLSVTALAYFFGALLMLLCALLFVDTRAAWVLTGSQIGAVLYGGIIASAVNYGLMSWANKCVGPAIVAMYLPLQPLASALLSRLFLNSTIYLGSILGGVLILSGLFLVTWGRNEADRLDGPAYRKLPVVAADHSILDPPVLGRRERKSP
ncbi:nodulin MtN21 [Klebsormidium nitens]|uniref:WAT1-related protein n=1 Tax=Klebsormidium nitens TaxID=105231 RepID=A0A1Y1HRB9_KLENI|nr:nodulin MtN21 [Klebsormidium nitens]|eukprot:GAQ79136.1 nodulin MtN21 [Klebsormidium nitens]